jgi:hypothetical protein
MSHRPVPGPSPRRALQRRRSVHFYARGQIGTQPVPQPCPQRCRESAADGNFAETFKMTVSKTPLSTVDVLMTLKMKVWAIYDD